MPAAVLSGVALYLQRYGYYATYVDGGMLAWEHVGRPVVCGDASPGAT
jgi:rhodanese-related sulfurtransferase